MVTSETINDATQTRFIPEKRYYCTKPFEQIQLLENGNMIPCCPPWINHYTIGNISVAIKNKSNWSKVKCYVYLLKMYADDEVFYKFGITTNINNRIKSINRDSGYLVDLLCKYETTKYDAIFIEKYNLERFEKYIPYHSNDPKYSFGGKTECFKIPENYNESRLRILTNFKKGWLEKVLHS